MMPFFRGLTGAVHYRSWTAKDPRLVLIFLHGMGQHSGHYHRFARVLNNEGIDVWAVDHVGHGLTEGELSDASHIGGLASNALQLAELARSEHVGVPLALMGHSLGAAIVVAALEAQPSSFTSAVLCGTPKPVTNSVPEFGARAVPLLAVHGVDDRLAPVEAVRKWIPKVPGARLREFENAGHDLLHEKVHRTVSLECAEFLLSHV